MWSSKATLRFVSGWLRRHPGVLGCLAGSGQTWSQFRDGFLLTLTTRMEQTIQKEDVYTLLRRTKPGGSGRGTETRRRGIFITTNRKLRESIGGTNSEAARHQKKRCPKFCLFLYAKMSRLSWQHAKWWISFGLPYRHMSACWRSVAKQMHWQIIGDDVNITNCIYIYVIKL